MLRVREKKMTKTMLALMIGAASVPALPAAAQDVPSVVRPLAGRAVAASAL